MHEKATLCALRYFVHEIVTLFMQKVLYVCKSYFMHGKATLCQLSYFMHEIATLCMQKLLYAWKSYFMCIKLLYA